MLTARLFSAGLLLCVLLGAVFAHEVRADIAVITNTGNPLNSLAAADIKRLFLKSTTQFPNGHRALISTLPARLPVTQAFYRNALQMTENELETYWAQYVFTGQKSPPAELTDEQTMRLWVSQTEGALGFINVDQVDDSVKVLRTLSANRVDP